MPDASSAAIVVHSDTIKDCFYLPSRAGYVVVLGWTPRERPPANPFGIVPGHWVVLRKEAFQIKELVIGPIIVESVRDPEAVPHWVIRLLVDAGPCVQLCKFGDIVTIVSTDLRQTDLLRSTETD